MVDESGRLTRQSMVYTEYFAAGTEPTDICDLHRRAAFFGAIAWHLPAAKTVAAHLEDAGAPPCRCGSGDRRGGGDRTAIAAAPAEPPKKKRGFWSRIFGSAKDKDDEEEVIRSGLETSWPFRDVIGHRRLVGLLARSIGAATLPPSLIFAGPAGVGKRLVAVATAQALNCLELQPSEPTAGRRSRASTPAAVARPARASRAACIPTSSIVEPGDSGSIKIDQVRDVVDRAGYRPFEGRRRVVIIDEADALVPAAQNAL